MRTPNWVYWFFALLAAGTIAWFCATAPITIHQTTPDHSSYYEMTDCQLGAQNTC